MKSSRLHPHMVHRQVMPMIFDKHDFLDVVSKMIRLMYLAHVR